jgi:hypothetical protein
VLHTGGLHCLRHVAGLRQLPLRRKVFPEVGQEKGAVRAFKGSAQRRRIVGIAGYDIGSGCAQRLCLLRLGIPGDSTYRERAAAVIQDGSNQSPALRSRGSDYGNGFLPWHIRSPLCVESR